MRAENRAKLDSKKQAFVDCWCGDALATAKAADVPIESARAWCFQPWFIRAVAKRTEQERKAAIYGRIALTEHRIADRLAVQQFWTSVMCSGGEATKDRLRASELLMKSMGEMLERVQLENGERRPMAVDRLELEDRIRLLVKDKNVMEDAKDATWLD